MNEPRTDYSRSNASSHTPPMQELQYHEVHPVALAMQTHAPVSASTACAVRKRLLPTSVVALCMCVLTWSFTKSEAPNVCLSHGENRCVEGRERVRQKKELSPADGLPICHTRTDKYFSSGEIQNLSSANPPECFTQSLPRSAGREHANETPVIGSLIQAALLAPRLHTAPEPCHDIWGEAVLVLLKATRSSRHIAA